MINHNGERVYDLDVYGELLRELLVPLAAPHVRPVAAAARADRRPRAAPARRLHADDHEPPGPARSATSRSGTTSPPTSPAARCAGPAIIVLLFLAWHLADFTWGWVNPDFVRGAVYRNLDASLSRIPVALLYIVANIALGIHLFHGSWSLFQSLGWNSPRFNRGAGALATGIATVIVVGNVLVPDRRPGRHRPDLRSAMTDTLTRPDGTITTVAPRSTPRSPTARSSDKWDNVHRRLEAGQPEQQAQVQGHRRRHRPGRRVGGGHAGRARLPGRGVHVPRLAAPGPLDRRPGRHQRGQELPRRRRQRLPAVLRHDQGRRLPLPGGATSTAWPRCRGTSSTRWSPRACRSPASTAACSTTAASAAPR